MRILDPGHRYELDILDKTYDLIAVLQFVKREGEEYPGNIGHYPGTTTQEVLRALIDRTKYVDQQQHWSANDFVIDYLRRALYELELRAAYAAGKGLNIFHVDMIETLPTCSTCGHIWCDGSRHE